MIKAVIRKRNGKFVSYEISGHAGSNGDNEFDIACADVSVLSITTANNLHRLAKIRPIAKMDEGYVYVELPLSMSTTQMAIAQLLLEAFVNAMQDVVIEFGNYIELIFEK